MSKEATKSLVARMGERFGVDSAKFFETLKATAFRQHNGVPPTNEQMMMLLIVAEQYNLNPFTREIYAFRDSRANSIVPVVGVDGWSRIVNDHKQYDGVEFNYSSEEVLMPGAKYKTASYIECVMYRKDRQHPTRVREYLHEVYRSGVKPWQTHTSRQLRHKAFVQCARLCFGFGGVYDTDEAERIVENDRGSSVVDVTPKPTVIPAAQEAETVEASYAEVETPDEVLGDSDRQKLDVLTDKLAQRVVSGSGAWGAAKQYVEQRFSDGSAERVYALERLICLEQESVSAEQSIPDAETPQVIEAEAEMNKASISGEKDDSPVEIGYF